MVVFSTHDQSNSSYSSGESEIGSKPIVDFGVWLNDFNEQM